ncbi:MAG: glycerol-3-phosphate acyltransferase, partial [Deltaproteobacteria bacterium]|nr:glycerol-3-phosphate acyltransferase [Deltaproteobacteria bacterium]
MEIVRPSPLERILGKIGGWFVRQRPAPRPDTATLLDLYNGGMFAEGNFFHRQILTHWAERIRADETHLETLRIKAQQGLFIYVTRNIGQLELIVLNNVLSEQKLPSPFFNNALRARRWLPLKKFFKLYRDRIGFLARHKNFPDPAANGFPEDLVLERRSILYSLEEWDPEFIPEETRGFLEALFEAEKKTGYPIFIVPYQLIWDKRPRREQASVFEALFGENERPGRWRKIILFFRHYKNRAIQKFSEPIPLSAFGSPLPLYKKIVGQLQSERKNFTGPVIHSHRWFLDHTLEDEGLAKTVYEIAKERRKPVDTIKGLALKYAREIAADLRYHYIEFVAAILHRVFQNLFEGVSVDTEGIKRLKKTLARGPVILTPNHRSHLDYLLLGYLCHQNDIVSPYVAAGINMAFWPMGRFFRRCGAFFLRRSFEGNLLYKKTFQTYLKILVREGYLQEFFIEGGRSRTGKLRSPKLGMLSMYSEAVHEGAAGDIFFMPVSITYDKVLEEKSYIEEMGGKPKQKEKFTDILRLTRFLKGRYGKIYVNFDEAISWQEAAAQAEALEWEKKKPQIVQGLANQICHAIN